MKNSNRSLRFLYGSPYADINGKFVFLNDIIYSSDGKILVSSDMFDKILSYMSDGTSKFTHIDGNITEETKKNNQPYFVYTMKPEKISINAIVIDAGHGGTDPGTYRGDVVEKAITLKTALRLENQLKRKYPDKKIIMTRRTDVFVPLEKRAQIANDTMQKYGQTLFISIHVNASVSPVPYGFETWYIVDSYKRDVISPGKVTDDRDIEAILNSMANDELYIDSKNLAVKIQDNLVKQIGDVSKNRGVKENTYIVVKNSFMPAVLVEIGFLSNKSEAKRLTNDAYLNRIIEGIFKGMCEFIDEYESVN